MSKLNCDKNIGDVIRKLREERNIKQSDVITFMQLNGMKMTKSTYSKIEAGKQHLKISELCIIKIFFKVSMMIFLKDWNKNIGATHFDKQFASFR